MGRIVKHNTRAWYFLPIAISILWVAFSWFLWLGDKSISNENRFMENSQVVFLALAFAFHWKQRLETAHPPIRACHSVLAMLCFSVMVREIDIDKIGGTRMWHIIENAIRFCVVSAWLSLAPDIARNFSKLWATRFGIFFSPNSLMTAVAVAFYLASWFFDNHIVPIDRKTSQFIEESLQLSGTAFFFAASLKPIRYDTINSKKADHVETIGN
jgi:hypothetical protein